MVLYLYLLLRGLGKRGDSCTAVLDPKSCPSSELLSLIISYPATRLLIFLLSALHAALILPLTPASILTATYVTCSFDLGTTTYWAYFLSSALILTSYSQFSTPLWCQTKIPRWHLVSQRLKLKPSRWPTVPPYILQPVTRLNFLTVKPIRHRHHLLRVTMVRHAAWQGRCSWCSPSSITLLIFWLEIPTSASL